MNHLSPIPEFPGYSASVDGEIFSGLKKLTPTKSSHKDPYFRVSVCRDNKAYVRYVHRLVLSAWVGYDKNKPHCNHINGVKSDNRLENLEWVTISDNHRHRVRVLGKDNLAGQPGRPGESNGSSKITAAIVQDIRRRYSSGESQRSIAKSLKIAQSNVSLIVHRRTWSHIG